MLTHFLETKSLFFALVIETIINQAYSNSIFSMIKYGQVMTSPSICKHSSLNMATWLPSSNAKPCPNSLRASKVPLMNPTLEARCEFWATSADVWRAMVGLALAPFQALPMLQYACWMANHGESTYECFGVWFDDTSCRNDPFHETYE